MAKIDACEFPTYEEMGKKVAEKALDEFLYNGKTIREWMQIIASEDAISRREALEKAIHVPIAKVVTEDKVICRKVVFVDDIENLPPVNSQESEPCDFCKDIYPDDDTSNIIFKKGKYSDVNKDSFITIDDEGKYWINIVPGDPYELGYLGNIKFCPYCGKKLAERSNERGDG